MTEALKLVEPKQTHRYGRAAFCAHNKNTRSQTPSQKFTPLLTFARQRPSCPGCLRLHHIGSALKVLCCAVAVIKSGVESKRVLHGGCSSCTGGLSRHPGHA